MKTLTLSGWGQPSDALANIAPGAAVFDYSAYADTGQATQALRAFVDAEHVIGWSLGGQLALHAIAAGALQPRRLTLIGVPFQFVKNDVVVQAMDRFTFDTFRNNYATAPERTATRFHSLLAKGDREARAVMQGLSNHPEIANATRWLPWLDVLDHQPLSMLAMDAAPATTIIHGSQDAIVPVAQAHMLAAALPGARVDIWEGAAHAPHLHDGARLQAAMQQQRSAA